MSEKGRNWTKEETMLAFELYCIIPKGKDTEDNPQIVSLAKAINRSPGAVKFVLQNIKSCDPSYTADGKVGLKNASAVVKEVSREFLNNWDALVVETKEIKKKLGLTEHDISENEEDIIRVGRDRLITQKQRIGQSFFRQALLAAYNYKCCFTGIDIPVLLRASHIKPWAESNDINEKANPRNGLLLNALHDSAFDNGYITITTEYIILVSKKLLSDNDVNKRYFIPLNEKQMILPSRFLPDKQFIEYHNSKFKGLYA